MKQLGVVPTEKGQLFVFDRNPVTVMAIGRPVLVPFSFSGGGLMSLAGKAADAIESVKPPSPNIDAYIIGGRTTTGGDINSYVVAVQYYKIIE